MSYRWRQLRRRPLVVVVAGVAAVLVLVKFHYSESGAANMARDQTSHQQLRQAEGNPAVAPPRVLPAKQGDVIEVPPGKVVDCLTGHTVRVTSAFRAVPIAKVPPEVTSAEGAETDAERRNTFGEIFEQRVWNLGVQYDEGYKNIQSSGLASNNVNTRITVKILNEVIDKLKHKLEVKTVRILDIPCGDMVWMNNYLRNRIDIAEYTGLDIVPEMIEKHKLRYKQRKNWHFKVHDIVTDPYMGEFDLVICRLLTQHLTNAETQRVLRNLDKGGGRFLLITDYGFEGAQNLDLEMPRKLDRYRRQNLQVEPFYLRPPMCSSRDSRLAGWISMWRMPLYVVEGCRLGAPAHQTRIDGQTFFHCA